MPLNLQPDPYSTLLFFDDFFCFIFAVYPMRQAWILSAAALRPHLQTDRTMDRCMDAIASLTTLFPRRLCLVYLCIFCAFLFPVLVSPWIGQQFGRTSSTSMAKPGSERSFELTDFLRD
ncbi:hypothetical protein QR685DRAFT_534299 [Neurospora intermedia]|uniref:Uncharacterized protein n=1 Tax=Neurospora intermedia TaxID=5142 RepID=A0ABR3D372_NEUIN